MKKHITGLSLHRNAKVMAILSMVVSFIILAPVMLMMMLTAPAHAPGHAAAMLRRTKKFLTL